MALLLLADLHFNPLWRKWLLQTAPKYEAVALAGDLLQKKLHRLAPRQQAREMESWMHEMPSPLAVATGNHDSFLLRPAHVLRGQRSHQLRRWIITVLDWPGPDQSLADFLLEQVVAMKSGEQMRRETGRPWLVLHHEPPDRSPLAAKRIGPGRIVYHGSPTLWQLLAEHQPNACLVGHRHEAPHLSGFWTFRYGKTFIFNAGQDQRQRLPHRIELDWKEGVMQATWHPGDEPPIILRPDQDQSQIEKIFPSPRRYQ